MVPTRWRIEEEEQGRTFFNNYESQHSGKHFMDPEVKHTKLSITMSPQILKIKIAVGYDFYVSMKRVMIDWYVIDKMYDFL